MSRWGRLLGVSERLSHPLVYIGGPYRTHAIKVDGTLDMFVVQQNIMRAMALALDVWGAGYTALCPHANTMFYTGSLPDEVWLQGDLVLLDACDALLLLPDWQWSAGALKEHAYAKQAGKVIATTLLDLKRQLVAQPWEHRAAPDGVA